MNKKNIIKLVLDIAMTILFITFFNKNLISFKFHIISGYIFAGFILVHIILNKKWIINISKRLLDKNLKVRTKLSYMISFVLFIDITLIILSGVLMMKSSNYDRLMFWKMMHFGASYISIVFIGIHVGFYWNFVMNMFKKILKLKDRNKNYKGIFKIITIIILVFGINKINSVNYFNKIINTTTYVIQHIEPQEIKQPEVNSYKKNSSSFTNLVFTYGSIISVFGICTYYGDMYIKRYNNVNSKINDSKKEIKYI